MLRDGTPILQLTADGEAIAAAPTGTGILGSLRLACRRWRHCCRRPAAPRRRHVPAPCRPPPARRSAAEYLFHALSRPLPEGAIVVEEAPSHRPALQAHLPIRHWGGFYTMATGGLGYSLPASVGVALAKPGRRIVCVIGDGS